MRVSELFTAKFRYDADMIIDKLNTRNNQKHRESCAKAKAKRKKKRKPK